jgi:geranylgeranylglycerol-phosphate geranylgeranyltransferase
MKHLFAYIKIIRFYNAFLAGIAVLLGYWLSRSNLPLISLFFLFIAAFVSTGFGNVINDIRDIVSDKISHPDRPLPKGEISVFTAWAYALLLVIVGISCSFYISNQHGIATLIPVIILTAYAFFLKGTPLIGNAVVASLVAYAILYGAINAPEFKTLIIPAILAFLLNFSREIIKDIQDEEGDRYAAVSTSAQLSPDLLRVIIYICTILYLGLIFIPFFRGDFGIAYAIICLFLTLPVHLVRLRIIISSNWKMRLSRISLLFKIEMIAGLLALLGNKLYTMVAC